MRPFPSDLIHDFDSSAPQLQPGFKEDWVRTDFIEPLLEALGWQQLSAKDLTTRCTGYRREVPIDAPELQTVPDYSMYVDGRRAFYVEAKKPSINIETSTEPAIQVREYGWNSGDPIGVITDFEEFAVYNCRLRPHQGDPANAGRVHYLRFDDYRPNWTWLVGHFSPEAVADGSLERLADEYRPAKNMRQVDEALLADVETWRVAIGQNLFTQNPHISIGDLNFAVQVVLDRILFLRFAESRGLQGDALLAEVAKSKGTYKALVDLFYRADARFNSGLFHFSQETGRPSPDTLTPSLEISDDVLQNVLSEVSDPRSPYLFDVMPADILGQMYEQMLGKTLEVNDDDELELVQKPEVRKAGGVFYTPEYIVRHIVAETLDPLVAGKTPNQVADLKVVDPSCGSGSFLLGAYQYLLDWHLAYYANLKRPDRKAAVRSNNVLRLTLAERKRILLNNIFGVDIDFQAVEVAKLSLLLKLVEGETQLDLAVQRLLPDLHSNIQCGNSLVGSDFHGTDELVNLTPNELREVNAFDWADGFPGVAEAGGFDAVIGNPPWLMAGYYIADAKPYLQRHFSVWKGKADLYYLFLEKASRIAKKPEGRIGMIIPSKLFHTRAGSATRELLTEGNWLESVIDFGIEAIFKKATNYSTILLLQQDSRGPLPITKSKKYFASPAKFHVDRSRLGPAPWHFIPPERQAIWDSLSDKHPPLSDVVQRFGNGAQTGADPLLIVGPDSRLMEGAGKEFFRPVLKGKDVRRYATRPSNYIFFPYKTTEQGFELVKMSELPQPLQDFLESERQKLEGRRWFGKTPVERSGDWYGLMYLDQAWAFEKPHILTPGFAPQSNFALGDGTLFVTGTAGVLSIIPADDTPESIQYLLAILNSKIGSSFICDHSTPYQGHFVKFTKNYIGNLPLRRIDFQKSDEKQLHDELVGLTEGAAERRAQLLSMSGPDADAVERAISQTQHRIDEIVIGLYELDETEIATVLEDD